MKALIPSSSSSLYKSFTLPFFLHKQIQSYPHQFHLTDNHPSITITMAACIHSSRTADTSKRADDYNKYLTFCRTGLSDCQIPYKPIIRSHTKTIHTRPIVAPIDQEEEENQALWLTMKEEAISDVDQEPILATYYFTSILSQSSLETALANHLAIKLSISTLPSSTLFAIFSEVLGQSPEIIRSVEDDLRAAKDRDPACISYVHCFLNFKGFLACQSHRVAHKLWKQGRKVLALLIQNRVSEVFAVDIHPGARIGSGILLDHATGVVVGETAVIGNNVSILHNVTLGGTGKAGGDRHPKIGDGVLIGAGTCILGNIKIGDGAKIGAGSVVVKEVPAKTTAVGNPARLIGGKENPTKLDKIPSFTMDHTSHISEWSDYVI